MSPSDLGQTLKPFVFLDIVDADKSTMRAMGDMPVHPHSGIATVTVFTEGHMRYADPAGGSGKLEYGGVEWMRAGRGVWHGKEMSAGEVPRLQGFQLWLALPPELETGEPEGRFVEAKDMVRAGPAHVIVGSYEGARSPLPAPAGINYLLVTLRPGETWTYRPPAGHTVGWLALAKGALNACEPVDAGEMVIFEPGEAPIVLEASGKEDAVFVLGSAVPHPHPLHLGNYSVHTSAQALKSGEHHIAELGRKLKEAGNRSTASGTIPVYR
jgi:redox-sensitive bicupin YhaK (pirin superfamily)